jgi:CubicO group peptidase (beta-lactamase class C family)
MAALALSLVIPATGCRTTAIRHVSGVEAGIERVKAGGSVREEADLLVGALAARGKLNGMAIGIVLPDGSTQVYGYGSAGFDSSGKPPDGGSFFQIGSLSKLLLCALLQQLVDEGRMRYEDTVREILPTAVPCSKDIGEVTIQELVTHTAGLPRQPTDRIQWGSFQKYLLTGRNLYAHIDQDYLHRYLESCKLKPRAGRQFEYSNFGMGLLAHLIHVKTGENVEEMMVRRICEPLGMTNTVFTLSPAQQPRLTVGHTGNHACWKFPNSRMPIWNMGEVMSPSAGLYSTVDDLLLFAKAHLGHTTNRINSALLATQEVQVASPLGGQTLGWIMCPPEASRTPVLYKHGMLSGYCGYIGIGLESRVAVVILSNRFDWDERVGHNLILRLAGAFEKPDVAR